VARVRRAPERYPRLADLARASGYGTTRLGDLFRRHAGCSPASFLRAARVAAAARALAGTGRPVLEIAFAAGFGSASAFHEAFRQLTGLTPNAYRAAARAGLALPAVTDLPESPAMLTDLTPIPSNLGTFRARFEASGALAQLLLPEESPPAGGEARPRRSSGSAEPLVRQLDEYAGGARRAFELPLALAGTPFQLRVWEELRRIPYGATISYGELARRIGRPAAVRAVAQACGANPVPVVVPCHRVVGADGRLVGYGGGLPWKRFLLELEGGLEVSGRARPGA
jgi:O-6-methylguanine DNA methyltransferase